LYPKDKINEKFLLKIRSCFSRISKTKVLADWMLGLNFNMFSDNENQEKINFLKELVHSSFNLVTDQKMRDKIKLIILEIEDDSLGKKILKSYLYLMLGYAVRSDLLLREILATTPFEAWKRKKTKVDVFDFFVQGNLDQILKKIKQHPHDRRIFVLMCAYFTEFFTIDQRYSLTKNCEFEEDLFDDDLSYSKKLAPKFVEYLSYKNKNNQKLKELFLKKVTDDESFYINWLWPIWIKMEYFLPQLSEKLEEMDNDVFLHYLIQGESLKDAYLKLKNKTFLHGKMSNLHNQFQKNEFFMLSLFKLIEYGDINRQLTERVSYYLRENGL